MFNCHLNANPKELRKFESDILLLHPLGIRVRILARILTKCELKKQLARWYFLYLHFLASGNLGLLSVVLILDINEPRSVKTSLNDI